jgi:F0F1-type ATP synthase assembly protein I
MAVDLLPNPTSNSSSEPSTTALVSGIAKDAQELLTQQIKLFKVEAEEDLRLTTQAAIALGIGLAIGLVGAILLSMGVVYLLDHFVPGYLWLWFLLVGAGVAAVGGVLVMGAMQAFSKINPPLPETQEAIKETLEWQTKQK